MAGVELLWARVTITEEENMQVQEDLPQQFGVDLKGRQLIQDLKKYWDAITARHRKLDNEIKDLQTRYANDMQIKQLKIQKLRIKEEIEIMKGDFHQFQTDSIRNH